MGSNGKLIFVLLVFGLQAILKEQMKVVNWGIAVFHIFVVSYSGCGVFYILLLWRVCGLFCSYSSLLIFIAEQFDFRRSVSTNNAAFILNR